MPVIATIVVSSAMLAFGIFALFAESGYAFDLRRKSSRAMLGGRRASDRMR